MNQINLDETPPNHTYKASIEPAESPAERLVRLFKDVVLFAVAIGFVGTVASLCYTTLQSASASSEEKKWAMSVLSAATGGIIGYLIRK